jgi:capsular polysaccharide biosynthesis protein
MLRLVLLRVLESYFRHRWLYLLPIPIMLVVAGYSVMTTTPGYISRGVLYVQKGSFLASLTSLQGDNGFSWVTPAQEATDEFSEMLQTDAFIRAVIAQTDLEPAMSEGPTSVQDTLKEARAAVWVSTLGQHLVLIGAAHEEPAVAQQLVDSVMETYTQWKIQADRQEGEAAQAFFSTLIDSYQEEENLARQELEKFLLDHPKPIRDDRPDTETLEIARLQAAVDLASKRVANALDKEEDARLAMAQAESNARQTYRVIDAPRRPDKPEQSTRQTLIGSAIYLIVGIVLVVVGIAGGALLDRSLRFPIDVRRRLNLPVLAAMPAPPIAGRRGAAAPKKPSPKGDTA